MSFRQVFHKIWRRVKRYYSFKKNNIKIARGSFVSSETTIGRYTRINAISHIGPCSIGSFCAIGGRLIVRSSDHYYSYLNMQDFFQSTVLKSKVKVAGKVKGKVFRIGHLGDFNELTLMGTLAGVEMGLSLADVPHQKGGVDKAMAYLTETAGGAS